MTVLRGLHSRPGAAPVAAAAISVVVAGTGSIMVWRANPYPPWVWIPAHLAGLSFAIAGAVLWWRRPGNLTGRLMTFVGITWYIGDLQNNDQRALFAIGFCFSYLSSEALAHMVLALPSGRLAGRGERILVTVQYILGPATQVPRFLVEHPDQPQLWGDPAADHSVFAGAGSVLNIVGAVTVLALVLRHWVAAGRQDRRRYGLVWAIAISLCLVSAVLSLSFLARAPAAPLLMLVFSIGLLLTPVGLAIGLLRVRLARTRIADLVVSLAGSTDPVYLQGAVAAALEDATLEIHFHPPGGGPVDAHGMPVGPPDPGRAVTPVGSLASLVHDPALADRRALVDAVVAALRIALENAHLHRAQHTQLRELGASRARLAAAMDDQRRRIQRDLHDGPQHRLMAASMLLERAREIVGRSGPRGDVDALARAAGHLRDTVRELREYTEGIYPPILTEQGLPAALERLAERAAVPVTVAVQPGRWPGPVERTAYFVAAEALANVYKHAAATRVSITVSGDEQRLVVEVVDDGRGGADAERGTGIRGLQDRAAALGGTLRVLDAAGGGTRLRAELPCG